MVIKKILACYNFCIRLVTKKNKTNIPRLSNGQSTRASNVPLVYSFRLTYSFPRKDNARQRRRDANVNVDCTLTCYFPFEMVEKKNLSRYHQAIEKGWCEGQDFFDKIINQSIPFVLALRNKPVINSGACYWMRS